MATEAHCAYVFECLAAHFERRKPISLAQVEELWEQYHNEGEEKAEGDGADDDVEMTEAEADGEAPRPAAVSRLLNRESSATSSSSSLPSTSTKSSNQSERDSSGAATPASSTTSSRTSLFKLGRKKQREAHPLFVTWNTVSRSGSKSLRGCIGTFEAQDLEAGLKSYALTSAFEDIRFPPIPSTLLPSLSTDVTLLTNFSAPTPDPMDWTLGTHGLRIAFSQGGRRFGATYLPDVAKEQGWTKEETLVSLMRKAGWSGSGSAWRKTWEGGRGELVRYEGERRGLGYQEWKEWRVWVERGGLEVKA